MVEPITRILEKGTRTYSPIVDPQQSTNPTNILTNTSKTNEQDTEKQQQTREQGTVQRVEERDREMGKLKATELITMARPHRIVMELTPMSTKATPTPIQINSTPTPL